MIADDDWADRADFTGRFDFWDLQRLGSFYLDTDGEVFALWTDEGGLPQIQMLDSCRIDKPTVADDRIFDGVQLDTQGRVLGYWLDGQTFLDANALVHLFELERYTQYRGMSPIRRGANDMIQASGRPFNVKTPAPSLNSNTVSAVSPNEPLMEDDTL